MQTLQGSTDDLKGSSRESETRGRRTSSGSGLRQRPLLLKDLEPRSRKRKYPHSFDEDYEADNELVLPVEQVRQFAMRLISKIFSGALVSAAFLWEFITHVASTNATSTADVHHRPPAAKRARHQVSELYAENNENDDVHDQASIYSTLKQFASSHQSPDAASTAAFTATATATTISTTLEMSQVDTNMLNDTNDHNKASSNSGRLSGKREREILTSLPDTSADFSQDDSDIGSDSFRPFPSPVGASTPHPFASTPVPGKSKNMGGDFLRSLFHKSGKLNGSSETNGDLHTGGEYTPVKRSDDVIVNPKSKMRSLLGDFKTETILLKDEKNAPLVQLPRKPSLGQHIVNTYAMESGSNASSVPYGTSLNLKRKSSRSKTPNSSVFSNYGDSFASNTSRYSSIGDGDRTRQRQRRKSVHEKFKDFVKTRHVNDMARSSIDLQSMKSGFPLSYSDQVFYKQAFDRARAKQVGQKPKDVRSEFIYSSNLTLPASSLESDKSEFYKQIHESRIKFDKEVAEFKLGLQKDAIPPLASEALDEIDSYFRRSAAQDNQVVGSGFRVDVKLRDLKTLAPGIWLNDSVIDFFLALVTQDATKAGLSKSFAHSTHFFTTLCSRGYEGVARWAKRKNIDVTQMDYVFVPVNQSDTHWCLAVVNNKERRFEFYNSLPSGGDKALRILQSYMTKESTRIYPERAAEFEALYASYDKHPTSKCPQQKNHYDCGVFTCTNVSLLSHNKHLNYSQQDMNLMRKTIAWSIISYGKSKI